MKFAVIIALCVWLSNLKPSSGYPSCNTPILRGGFIAPPDLEHRHGAKVYYSCDAGKKPAVEGWWGVITCNNGHWSHSPMCIDANACLVPNIPNAEAPRVPDTGYYQNGQEFHVNCVSGFTREKASKARCTNGVWTLPQCERLTAACDTPKRLEHGVILAEPKHTYFRNSVQYDCQPGYVMRGDNTVSCIDGNWEQQPECVLQPSETGHSSAETVKGTVADTSSSGTSSSGTSSSGASAMFGPLSQCGTIPTIEHGDIEVKTETQIKYKCKLLFRLEGNAIVRCMGRAFTSTPTCIPPCELDKMIVDTKDNFLEDGKTETYHCKSEWASVRVQCVAQKLLYRGCGHKDW